jgi:hypothetical protein
MLDDCGKKMDISMKPIGYEQKQCGGPLSWPLLVNSHLILQDASARVGVI